MAKPRILLITPAICRLGGGVAEALRLLAHALAARDDLAVEVVTLSTPDLAADRAGWPDVPIHAFAAIGPRSYGFSPGMLAFLLRQRADLAHLHGVWMFPALAACLWSRLRRRPLIISPHGMLERWILARSPWRKAAVTALYQRRCLARAAAVQALTTAEASDVSAHAPAARCHVIPNFLPAQPLPDTLPDWWQPDMAGRRIHLFLGRIHDKKGWRALCAAWDQLCDDAAFARENWLVFCGWSDGAAEFGPTLAALSTRHGNATYAGPQHGTAKMASLWAADLFVLPSHSEGLPMVILEAWAAGVPVLMSAACNLPEGFATGAARPIGIDAGAIAAALRGATRWHEDERQAMIAAGRQLVESTFSQAVVVAQLVALYDQMMQGEPR